ncbi:hypothetical protein [Parendozoicomonas sp. Alg238-R29]|uniref:hypothetical protein n=1 Tax=Parendozoicomonas sp. Alg238-R29 TaxID=2993446 RepID=UPI00248E1D1B|nr:hypothetical protein [Parendozoicomonas sp. Alg238-R29]
MPDNLADSQTIVIGNGAELATLAPQRANLGSPEYVILENLLEGFDYWQRWSGSALISHCPSCQAYQYVHSRLIASNLRDMPEASLSNTPVDNLYFVK